MPNLAGHLYRQAKERPGKVALIDRGEPATFGDLRDRVGRAAGGLRGLGVGPNGRVGIMLSSRVEFIVFQQAAFALGATVTPLNIHYRASEILHALTSCDLEWLVIEDGFRDRVPQELPAAAPSLRRILVLDGAGGPEMPSAMIAAEPVLAGEPIPGPVDMDASSCGLMLSTSATTGKAKGVMLSIANIQSNYDATPGWLGLSERDTILCALPLYNTFGLNQCINATMLTGCTLVLLPRFEVGAVLEAIDTYRPTFLPAVPTMLQKLLSDPATPAHDLRSIERILVGAAPVPGPLLERIRGAMGADVAVMQGYGLTEATAIVTIMHVVPGIEKDPAKLRSVGRTLPGIAMMIADEAMTRLGPDEVGEICIRGPNVMEGYYRQPEETAAAIADGWLRTGDLGTVDAEGYYFVVDRKKDVIIRGGQNVYPADIEEVLYRCPSVGEAAVVAEADGDLGEVPVAFVSLKPGHGADPEELRERCRSELAYYKVPRRVVILPELPKGPTGKILRRELRAAGPASSPH